MQPLPLRPKAVERAETRRLVQRALEQLSADHRLVVVLYYLGGLDYARIAAFLEVPVSTVEGRLRRARTQLKTQLKGRLLTMIEDTLHAERLSPDFVPTTLEEALKRAREAHQRWSSEDFIHACRQAMEAAVRREEVQPQIEVLCLLGEANASWLGKGEQAVEHYAAAIALARDHQQTADEARLLRELMEVHGRHGHFEAMGASARQAQALFAGRGDRANQALMAAALELAELLPGRWQPGEPGGYALAAFTVEHGPEGHGFQDPAWVRHYSWGCPARGAALAHLLEPRRFLGPSLAPGAAWEDRLTGHRPGLTWGLAEGNELVARSTVEATDEQVVVPAGRFPGCLRVKTCLAPLAGGRGKEYGVRSCSGTRIAWYAPGVGLVKLRHQDQNDTVWCIHLIEYEGAGDVGYFPLDPGRTWRYRWNDSLTEERFEDCCRVVSSERGTAWIASATVGVEPTPAEQREDITQRVALDRAMGDLEGEALSLSELVGRLDEGETAPKLACYDRLMEIGEIQGDEWRRFEARWARRAMREELTPRQQTQHGEERCALARRLGDQGKLFASLRGLAEHHRRHAQYQEAARLFESAAALAREEAEGEQVTSFVAEAELSRAMAEYPWTSQVAYLCGDGRLVEHEDGRIEMGSSGRYLIDERPFPPGTPGSPMLDFFFHTPFAGVDLLSGKNGAASTDGVNTRVVNYGEHMRENSCLQSRCATVVVPAGSFDPCVQLETQIVASAERHGRGPEVERVEREHAYYAGVKTAWYAPGVGLVRLLYQHHNGRQTAIELIGYELAQASDTYLPLALDNRWRYRWTDPESGTRFEETLRVAVRNGPQWRLAFVTRARACGSGDGNVRT